MKTSPLHSNHSLCLSRKVADIDLRHMDRPDCLSDCICGESYFSFIAHFSSSKGAETMIATWIDQLNSMYAELYFGLISFIEVLRGQSLDC